ncbi:hypothetical protein FISHEDRAFT_61774, partial [Fistulina hepatica ATCC 64428]
IPSIDISVAGDCNDQHTHHALLQLVALMRSWPNCPPLIRDLSIITDVESMKTDIARFYCQAFFDEFGRAPVLPCRVIPRSTPPPSRSPTPVPRSPSQSIEPDVDDAPLDLAPSDEALDDLAAARTAGAASPKECDSPLLPVGTPSDPSDPNARVVRPAAASSPAIPVSSPAAATSSPATAASSPAAAASSPAAAASSPAAAVSSPAATTSSLAATASSPAVPASLPAAVPLPVVTVPSPAAAVSLLAAVVPSDEQPEDQGPANMDLPTADKSPSPQSDMYLYDMQGRPLGPATIVPESIEGREIAIVFRDVAFSHLPASLTLDDMVVEETASKKRTRKTKSSAKGKGKAIVRTDRVLRSSHQSDANVPLVLSNSFSEVIDISDDESIDIDFQRPSDLGNDTEELPTLTSSTGVKNHLQRAPARASAPAGANVCAAAGANVCAAAGTTVRAAAGTVVCAAAGTAVCAAAGGTGAISASYGTCSWSCLNVGGRAAACTATDATCSWSCLNVGGRAAACTATDAPAACLNVGGRAAACTATDATVFYDNLECLRMISGIFSHSLSVIIERREDEGERRADSETVVFLYWDSSRLLLVCKKPRAEEVDTAIGSGLEESTAID